MNEVLYPPLDLDRKEIKAALSIKPGTNSESQIERILDDVERIAKPKAAYQVSYVEKRSGDTVLIDQVEFRSQALSANLETVNRVFPYVATCGTEVDSVPIDPGKSVHKYWLDTIRYFLLRSSIQIVHKTIQDLYQYETLSAMNPGSGEAEVWPIEQQRPLFALLGGQQQMEELIGVRLLDSLLMSPMISVSGIFFPSEAMYVNCQLCQREDCPGRQAPFDAALWEKRMVTAHG